MSYRFTIRYPDNSSEQINEPIGWDGFGLKVKRHAERHGTMREIQNTDFEFEGRAFVILQKEYELRGAKGDLTLEIDWTFKGDYSNLYTGKLRFKTYREKCGPTCSVTMNIEQIGALVNFIYNLTQKVDLDAVKCFDGVTDLVDYPTRKPNILLHTKAIVLQDKAVLSNDVSYDIDVDSGWYASTPLGTGLCQGSINPVFDTIQLTEYNAFTPDLIADYLNHTKLGEAVPPILKPAADGPLNCMGTDHVVDFRVKGRFIDASGGASGTVQVYLVLRRGNTVSSGFSDTPNNTTIWSTVVQNSAVPNTAAFDISHTDTVTVLPGEKLWLTFFITYFKSTNYFVDYTFEMDKDVSFFTAKTSSQCDDSQATGYLINEAMSRVTECITNNQLKVYSSYYGRTDSLPYSVPVDGCGSLRTIHCGLDIRNAKLSDGSNPRLFISMEDILKGIVPIDNVGLGFEKHAGQDVIRVENWKYFYKNKVTLSCKGIFQIERITQEKELYSTLKVGYRKWEAEEYNGLDEFLTSREYRTSITGVQNALEVLSEFIASGYAIEVTRRKGGDGKDWRYDNNTFIICLKRAGGDYESENGIISTPSNIIDPDTVLNYRISPARNAMRWYGKIMSGIKTLQPGEKLVFGKGDGNYLASGMVDSVDCVIESHVISESQDITAADFADPDEAAPIADTERIKFVFPVTNEEFINMDLDGEIEFDNGCEKGSGWIDEFVFKPDRDSEFLLIPKRD